MLIGEPLLILEVLVFLRKDVLHLLLLLRAKLILAQVSIHALPKLLITQRTKLPRTLQRGLHALHAKTSTKLPGLLSKLLRGLSELCLLLRRSHGLVRPKLPLCGLGLLR